MATFKNEPDDIVPDVKKKLEGFGIKPGCYMKYSYAEKYEIIRVVFHGHG